MKTTVRMLNEEKLDQEVIREASQIIKDGGLVTFPTETVYGLGANALDDEAVKNIFIAKGRPQDNPLIVHISNMDELEPLVREVPEVAEKFMKEFWPGPMTIILPKSDLIPETTSAGLDSVGIRMPSNIIARELIRQSGVPIAAPSANISGRPSPTDVERCIEDLSGKVDYIIGGPVCQVGVESTIIDCTSYPPCVLRPGGITLEMLKSIEPKAYVDPTIMKKPEKDFKPKAPGMKYRHYAPKAPVKIICGDLQKTIEKINKMVQNYKDGHLRVGIMATDETAHEYDADVVISLGSREQPEGVAKNLFETLRKFDDEKVDVILSESFDEEGVGLAIMNRLKKSAGFDLIFV